MVVYIIFGQSQWFKTVYYDGLAFESVGTFMFWWGDNGFRKCVLVINQGCGWCMWLIGEILGEWVSFGFWKCGFIVVDIGWLGVLVVVMESWGCGWGRTIGSSGLSSVNMLWSQVKRSKAIILSITYQILEQFELMGYISHVWREVSLWVCVKAMNEGFFFFFFSIWNFVIPGGWSVEVEFIFVVIVIVITFPN